MGFVKQEVRGQVVPGCDGEEGEGSQEVVRGCARGCPLQLGGGGGGCNKCFDP